jgi:hypothetical protein
MTNEKIQHQESYHPFSRFCHYELITLLKKAISGMPTGEIGQMLIAESENFSSTSAILDRLKKKQKNKIASEIRFTEDDFKNGISFDVKVS